MKPTHLNIQRPLSLTLCSICSVIDRYDLEILPYRFRTILLEEILQIGPVLAVTCVAHDAELVLGSCLGSVVGHVVESEQAWRRPASGTSG